MAAMIGGHLGFPTMQFLYNLKSGLNEFRDAQNLGLDTKIGTLIISSEL
jgi:hypothetical protein